MECFMRNLPSHLTVQSLQGQLSPWIKALNITEWSCDKPHGKSYGTVAFLSKADGEKFLRQHSEVIVPGAMRKGRPVSQSRLKILGMSVYCNRSKNEPDPYLLKSMQKTREDNKQQDQTEPEKQNAVVFQLRGLSCGHYEFPLGHLTYLPDKQWTHREIGEGILKFAKHLMIVTFDYPSFGQLRLEIPYRTINELVTSTRPPSLTLTLWESPRIFQEEGVTELMQSLHLANNSGQRAPRTRLSAIPHCDGGNEEILGQTLVYSFAVSPEDFHHKVNLLKQKTLTLAAHGFVPTPYGHRSMNVKEDLRRFNSVLRHESMQSIPFDVRFQLHVLVQNGYLLPRTVHQLLLEISSRMIVVSSKQGPRCPISASAIKKLQLQIPFPGPESVASDFSVKEIWSYLESYEKEVRQGLLTELTTERARQNLVMVYKVQVTPTRILLQGPEPEAKNRILRKFPQHTQHFARVQFCEEDGQDLYFNSKVSLERIWSRFRDILAKGISIAGRQYDFLGFSHSSLRAHAAWFMAPFFDTSSGFQTHLTVRANIGDFKHITSPARCAARIGQAFSETPFSISLKALGAEIRFIDDVKSSDKTRVFSDGVGTISRELLDEIQWALPHRNSSPTCLQIRWAGAKGMLALDDTLEGMVMCIRPESMVKFKSQDEDILEICDIANKPIPLFLNRPMIKVLEDMGCPEEWFLKVQNRELERLRKITAHVDNTVVFLKRQKVADQIRFSQFIRRLHKIGIDYKHDRFLCSVVETVVLREIRLLKLKARIPVEKGVTLFGVMDEYSYLDKGEVFITFQGLHGANYLDLHNREVLLTRSPALHPGDIQIARAVVPPFDHPLRSLKNCIVFSQRGTRDLPSQLSGGDLDGDIFNVIWDDMAVSLCTRIFDPADYPRVLPYSIGREVKMEDMTQFFVQFMSTDQLGMISIRHLILADQKPAGTVDQECQKLAELHSTAVDYSKTGIPVEDSELRKLSRPKYRPDFMAPAPPAELKDWNEIVFDARVIPATNDDEDDNIGPQYQYYKSDRILGKLYRAIDERRIWNEEVKVPAVRHAASVWDKLLLYVEDKCEELGRVDWRSALQEAHGIREAYDDAILSATLDFSEHSSLPISEIEVFTGCIFNKNGSQTRRQRDKSTRLRDEFDQIAKWAESAIRKHKVASRVDNDETDDEDDEDDGADGGVTSLELSIACLVVSCVQKQKAAGSRAGKEFQSFKVVAASCVLRELDAAIKRQEISDGVVFMGGMYHR
ncbi:hypothetical protein SLS62_005432 [Diatrype stigma]|uniref:RNA-dependent RNA polymerase n=1 Tax=Diatrype stigma TaxID=117547 RepID=A0AAN9V369_9PEZI